MKTIFLLLATVLICVSSEPEISLSEYVLENPRYPFLSIQSLESFKTFAKLVEENQLNVTIIVSQISHYGNDHDEPKNLKAALSIGVTFPLNKLASTEKKLNKEQGQDILKKATAEKLPARVFLSKVEGSQGWSNKPNAVPVTQVHKLLGRIHDGQTGFSWHDKNYIVHRTFIIPGDDGKNETVKVVFGDLDIQLIQSQNLSDEDVETVKAALGRAYFTYVEDDFAEGLIALLKSTFPNEKWAVAIGVKENNYIKAKKTVIFRMFDKNYLIFSI